jgi:DNA topoisomerase IB
MAKQILFDDKTPPPPIPKTGVQKLVQSKLTNVYKLVSNQLNNSPTMAKNSYIHPAIINEWLKSINVQL